MKSFEINLWMMVYVVFVIVFVFEIRLLNLVVRKILFCCLVIVFIFVKFIEGLILMVKIWVDLEWRSCIVFKIGIYVGVIKLFLVCFLLVNKMISFCVLFEFVEKYLL